MNDKLTKWIEWINIISKETANLLFFNDLFNSIKDTYLNNKVFEKDKFIFYDFIVNGYFGIVIIGLRRQLKIDKSSVSFLRLLTEIKDNPDILTKQYYCGISDPVSLVDNFDSHIFEEYWGKGAHHVSSEIIEKDISSFKELAKNVEKFADKRLAHFEVNKTVYSPSFPELLNVVLELEKLVHKYYLFLKKADLNMHIYYDKYWINIFDHWKSKT